MELIKIVDFIIVFLFGFLSALFFGLFFVSGIEFPLLNNISLNYNVNVSPSDYVKESDIQIFKDRIVIFVDGASLSSYAPTGSMKPMFDAESNGIRIKPLSEDDINIGDIISFKKNNILIVHRVIEKNLDEEGIYFITKGDNNLLNDGKVRFKDIEYKTIGILY